MKIYLRADAKQAGTYVNKIGKYLKQHLDGVYRIAFHPMECEVFFKLFYEIPGDKETFSEMNFVVSITSYQNKVRMNITEDSPREKTIGQCIISIEEVNDLSLIKEKFLDAFYKAVAKEYEGFDFIY